ncbi:transposase-like zinc ribbon protein [Tenacibaculum discolor]|uniref:IS1595 family transposase n=1 Tax=Tenacibaculum singaporense TaxID=2358479 RepID=A0A3Q8RKI7_9FLAO|nr:IS1595 family transposase [Tenacibaculum singaporense]RLK07023.1 transposase-like zinc ribbon protein [Tenacibaculum discolor]
MKTLLKFRNIVELIEAFPTDEKCREYLVNLRWGEKSVCPHCNHSDKIYNLKTSNKYKCSSCKKQFTVTTGTIFHQTHVSLVKWFVAFYLFSSHKKGLSSIQLSKDIGVTQKTAWFMLHRIRYAMKDKSFKLFGQVEVDETYVGGKNKNRHFNKKVRNAQGRSTKDKSAIFGFVERGGRVRTIHIKRLSGKGMRALLRHFVEDTSVIYSDEFRVYRGLKDSFEDHFVVNHSANEYVSDHKHTNTIEGFWSQLKRGIFGVYHNTSKHLLYRYCQEFEFRWNTRQLSETERFSKAISQGLDGRMTYAMAIDRSRRW